MKKILVVGAGLSGSTIAERATSLGHDVTVIEKRDHIGGNCFDYIDENGILINKYGAHIFHTNSEKVWNYVNRFSEWVPWNHQVLGKIDDLCFPIPVNIDTVNILTDQQISTEEEMKIWLNNQVSKIDVPLNSKDVGLSKVGSFLYEKIFKDYTWKQWGIYPEDLEPSVLERIPVRTNRNADYFSDKYQALPKNGYTCFIMNMLKNVKVVLNCEYNHDMKKMYDYIFFTGPIDVYYKEHNYPKLEYRSINFVKETINVDLYQQNSVVNYPSLEVDFTRIVEYKHFLNQKVPGKTTIVKEYTTSNGDPYYPIPTEKNREIYNLYQKLALEDEKNGLFFIGRLANYKYYNMDVAIEKSLDLFEKVFDDNL
jgi:UDP-galactopyranose mutase